MPTKCARLEDNVTADPRECAATVQIDCRANGNDDHPIGEWSDIVEAAEEG